MACLATGGMGRETALQTQLDTLNAATTAEFIAALGDVFEDAPWVAAAAADQRPFATVAILHAALMAAVRAAPEARILAFLRGHPELAGGAAAAGAIGAASAAEQAALGLQQVDLGALNTSYGARFGFPFILCVRRHTRASLRSEFQRRVANDAATEREAALCEIGHITRLRLVDRVSGPGTPTVHGSLTTHVLDTAVGRPAAGCRVELLEVGGETMVPLATATTNADGRTDRPLLDGGLLRIGVYELRFHVGAYFALQASAPTFLGPAFLEIVPVRFGIAEPETHYHVPLLVSPGAYSTYRGS